MRATAEVIEGNRVKLSVEVPEDELKSAEEETIRRLLREVRIDGFRPGKVPRRLLVQRLGARAIRDEVIRDTPDYYQSAVNDAELDIISQPEVDITSGEESGPLAFDAVVEIRPRVSIAGYEGLVVTVPSPEVSDDEIAGQVDRLRDQFATLTEVDRPARDGDHVTLNVTATRNGEVVEGLSADDFVYPVGSERLVPGADEKLLLGAKVGEIVEVDVPDARGGPAQVRILVKEVREKVLPEPDDAWAEEASEFDTLEELRTDIRNRIAPVKRAQTRMQMRENAVEALAELVGEELPETLIQRELARRTNDLNNYLTSRRINFESYLAATGKSDEELIADLTTASAAAVRADLGLRALVEAEQIDVDDDEFEREIELMAVRQRKSPAEVMRRLERSGQSSELRSEMRNAKAVTWLVEHVGVVDDQGNPVDRTALFDEDDGDDGDPSFRQPAMDGPDDGAESDDWDGSDDSDEFSDAGEEA